MSESVASIVTPVIERQQDAALRRLLTLREDRPDAAPKLARYLGGTQLVTQRIRLGYDAYEARPQFTSARDAIEDSGYSVVHSLAVACATVDALGLEGTWPDEARFWVWTCSHALMSMLIAEAAPQHRDIAFAGTFLRNVGQLLIRQHLGPDDDRIATAVEGGATVIEAEQSVLGFTHLDLMREIAARWELGPELMSVFDEFPEPGSVGRLFWKAKRTLHRLGMIDPSGPMDVAGAPLHPELEQFIASVGGIHGFVRLSNPYLASTFISGEARADIAIDQLLAA